MPMFEQIAGLSMTSLTETTRYYSNDRQIRQNAGLAPQSGCSMLRMRSGQISFCPSLRPAAAARFLVGPKPNNIALLGSRAPPRFPISSRRRRVAPISLTPLQLIPAISSELSIQFQSVHPGCPRNCTVGSRNLTDGDAANVVLLLRQIADVGSCTDL